MKVPPKRTTLLDRIAKWGQHGVRPELLLTSPQAGRSEKGAAAAAAAMRPPNQPVMHSQVFPARPPARPLPSRALSVSAPIELYLFAQGPF